MDTYTNTGFFTGSPIFLFAPLIIKLLSTVIAIFIAAKFYKLQKEKKTLLKEITNKLDNIKK